MDYKENVYLLNLDNFAACIGIYIQEAQKSNYANMIYFHRKQAVAANNDIHYHHVNTHYT